MVSERMGQELIHFKNGFAVMCVIPKLVQKSLSDGYLVGSRGSVLLVVRSQYGRHNWVNSLPPHYSAVRANIEFITDGR